MGVVVSTEGGIRPQPAREQVRVLHVYSGNLFGGVEWFLRTLATHGGHAPWMASEFALCFDAKIAHDLRERGAAVHILGPARVRSPRRADEARQALARVLQAGHYDVVVCHSAWPHAMFASVVREQGIPLVQFMHDVPNARGWVDHLANRTPPDVVMCNTHFMETSGRWWFRDVPRQMVRYPVPLGHRAAAGSRAVLRESLGAGPNDVVILHASRMQEWKGHRVLIRALAALRANPRWSCWIAGGGQRPAEAAYERSLHAQVARLGLTERIRFLGHRDDVPAVMEAADIYCQPNVAPEPFGVSFLEALAAGLPIVTTAMGAPLEIVDDTCGTLVASDMRAVSAALTALIDDDVKRATLAKGAPARARELCDVETRIRDLAVAFSSFKALTPSDPPAASVANLPEPDPVLSTVARLLRERGQHAGTIVDLGCRSGEGGRQVDLDAERYPFDDAMADAVVSIETIDRLENPHALVREMSRIVRPGGWIVVTTSNQLSLASKLSLVTRNRFPAFQATNGADRPHITALIESDLRRIASLCGLVDVEFHYAGRGRRPLASRYWPSRLPARGRWFSDNVVLVARRP